MISNEYIAGIMDGEGYIGGGYSKTGKKRDVEVIVQNTNEDLCRALQSQWGGKVKSRHSGKANDKTIYRWLLPRSKNRQFIESIIDHLIVKKEQAGQALEELR